MIKYLPIIVTVCNYLRETAVQRISSQSNKHFEDYSFTERLCCAVLK
jgi:hypothetical protein